MLGSAEGSSSCGQSILSGAFEMLTPVQKAHVDAVFPECKAQMASYLEGGVEVVIGRQTECGPDVPPIAIAVAADQSFWIDCCDSEKLARARAKELGLRVGARSIPTRKTRPVQPKQRPNRHPDQ